MRKGLTLVELIITVTMLAILVGVVSYLFRAILISWSGQEIRAGIDISLDRTIEEMVRELREAREVGSVNNDEIRFSLDNTSYYIYYLYNEDDAYPPTFNQDSYQLRRATLTGTTIGGAPTSVGRIIMTDIVPPPLTDLLVGDRITIDLRVKRGDETIRSRTEVKPRNL